jgi:hypothetical protein
MRGVTGEAQRERVAVEEGAERVCVFCHAFFLSFWASRPLLLIKLLSFLTLLYHSIFQKSSLFFKKNRIYMFFFSRKNNRNWLFPAIFIPTFFLKIPDKINAYNRL